MGDARRRDNRTLTAATDGLRLARLVAQQLDPVSQVRLRALQVGRDGRAWRCLTVGDGTGSMAQWLADEVGPRGKVMATTGTGAATATDETAASLPHLDEHPRPNVTVKRFDLATDELPTACTLAFDLVHCRLALAHQPDPVAALRKLADAVAPGGVLLVEEWDIGPLLLCDETRSDADALPAAHALLCDAARDRGIDLTLGRRLLQLVEATELTDVAHLGTNQIWRGAHRTGEILRQATALLTSAPPTQAAADVLDAWLAALDDPAFAVVGPTLHSVSAHRPPL